MKILIADDEVMSRKMLQKPWSSRATSDRCWRMARLAADHLCPPDGPRLALLDWVMLSWTGRAFAAKVRQR